MNDLTQIITHLHLGATPGSTPSIRRPSRSGERQFSSPKAEQERPVKKSTHRTSSSSTGSLPLSTDLRSKSPSTAPPRATDYPHRPGPQLIPLNSAVSSSKPTTKTTVTPHRPSTSAPVPDASPIVHSLRPAKRLPGIARLVPAPAPANTPPVNPIKASSSLPFGSQTPTTTSRHHRNEEASPSPPFRKADSHTRQRSLLFLVETIQSQDTTEGSAASGFASPGFDASDPDSDIPRELRAILSESAVASRDSPSSQGRETYDQSLAVLVEDPATLTSKREELPVFRAQLVDEGNNLDQNASSEDAKKSFNFTGELPKLQSGAPEMASFTEQVQNAFKTPAGTDLEYDFDRLLAPPGSEPPAQILQSVSKEDHLSDANSDSLALTNPHVCQPDAPLASQDSVVVGEFKDILRQEALSSVDNTLSTESLPIDDELNGDFKSSGRPNSADGREPEKCLTLSDIIPPPSRCHSLSDPSATKGNSPELRSTSAHASGVPSALRLRLNSNSSSKGLTKDFSVASGAHQSACSTQAQSSALRSPDVKPFAGVGRVFEFPQHRPELCLSQSDVSQKPYGRQESTCNFASVVSNGISAMPGSKDACSDGLPLFWKPSPSEDASDVTFVSVDDTCLPWSDLRRQRANSDTAGFFFRTPRLRRHLQSECVAAQGPPISLYNRNLGVHPRDDSSSSASALAHSNVVFGANSVTGDCEDPSSSE